MREKVEMQKLGSKEFWKITNRILNRGKSPIPTLINGLEVLTSSKGKASLSGNLLASYGNLDDGGSPLPEFSQQPNSILST